MRIVEWKQLNNSSRIKSLLKRFKRKKKMAGIAYISNDNIFWFPNAILLWNDFSIIMSSGITTLIVWELYGATDVDTVEYRIQQWYF